MEQMKYLLGRVRDEMEDASEYADMAQKFKGESPQAGKVLMALSEQERGHAAMLMQEAKNMGRSGEGKMLCDYEDERMQQQDEKLRHKWEKFKKE